MRLQAFFCAAHTKKTHTSFLRIFFPARIPDFYFRKRAQIVPATTTTAFTKLTLQRWKIALSDIIGSGSLSLQVFVVQNFKNFAKKGKIFFS